MMIFDFFCDIVERWFPELVFHLQIAPLIKLDATAQDVLDRPMPRDEMIALAEAFRMPSSMVTIEGKKSCVLLADRHPPATGLMQTRLFIDCMPIDSFVAGFTDASLGNVRKLAQHAPQEACIVVAGGLCPAISAKNDWVGEVSVLKVFVGSAISPMYGPVEGSALDPATLAATQKHASLNAMSAMKALIDLWRPHKWHMTRIHPRQRSSRPIPRSRERVLAVPVLLSA